MGNVLVKTFACPYLTFNGKAAEAMEFYHSILGGELTMRTFGENNMGKTEEEKKRIIHSELRNDMLILFAGDTMVGKTATFGDNFTINFLGEDGSRLTEIFEKLAKGGRVDMPLARQFWGDTYGLLTDKYGIHWAINISQPKDPEHRRSHPQE